MLMAPATPGLPVLWDPAYEVDIGLHVFPTRKYRLVRDRLVAQGTIAARDIIAPTPATDDDMALVHTAAWLQKIKTGALSPQEQLILEVPFSSSLRDAMWLCTGGTTEAGRLAMERGVAAHLGGGFHHAFPGHGEGFCLINDVAIAVQVLRRDGAIRRAAVIDLDVHHGNGTAAIFQSEPDVFTFSMHQERNYPAWKPPGDLDVGLDDGIGDAEYLALLERHLPTALDHAPDLTYYLAGADPYRHDQLGGLGLTLEGLRRRDEAVLAHCGARGIPVAVTLAGGYALNPDDTVEIHCNTVRTARSAVGG